MKRASQKIPNIQETELTINQFTGLNTFGPHSDLDPYELRTLVNMDVFGPSSNYAGQDSDRGYLKTRRGSSRLNNDKSEILPIPERLVFDAGDKEFVIIQQLDFDGLFIPRINFIFCELSSTGTFKNVLEKSTLSPFRLEGTATSADMMMSNGKIYVFSNDGNSVIEYNSTSNVFLRRKMGLPAPRITEVASSAPGVPGEGLDGKRVYGVELVYKDTNVTPNVDIIVSGPNRAIALTTTDFKEGRLAFAEGTDLEYQVKVSATLNDGTLITDTENSNWTHIRLYRTKDVTTATNSAPDLEGPAEIIGREDELYQVQEMDKATFLATFTGTEYVFDIDNIPDDDMPFPLDVVTGDRLDMSVIPAAEVGVFHRNRIWVSGVEEVPGPGGAYSLDSISSKIFFTPETATKYSESSRALDAIESDPGDGERMIKLMSFQEDLIGIKEGKTGRVPYGDPNSGWVVEDHVIGIQKRKNAQFVPQVGICAIVNDQDDFRIFGYDLKWSSNFAGLQVSRPIRDVISTFNKSYVDFLYMNGKLFISGGNGQFLVLGAEQRRGWALFQYQSTNVYAAVTYNEGRSAVIIGAGQELITIEDDSTDQDYNSSVATNVDIDYSFTTYRFQGRGGRSLIEQRYLSIVAILQNNISVQPYVNGRLWEVPFNMLLDPSEYPYDELKETEYQGYSEVKPLGNYIHYVISGKGPATFYSIMLNCLIQDGQLAAGFDPFQVLQNAKTSPGWADTIGIKDAGDTARVIGNYTINDAGDTGRTIGNYQLDDAGDTSRS